MHPITPTLTICCSPCWMSCGGLTSIILMRKRPSISSMNSAGDRNRALRLIDRTRVPAAPKRSEWASTARMFLANMGRGSLWPTWSGKMPRTPGSGNARWRAATIGCRFKRGRPGFRKCAALKRNGEPCGNLSMRHVTVCQCHGGRMLTARLRRREKAYRYGRFIVA